MNAKQQLLEFLRTAPQALNCEYKFIIPADTTLAEAYLHRMRVELSRLRNELKNRGLQLRAFKIQQRSITPIAGGTEIILRFYDKARTNFLAAELGTVFDIVTTGRNTISYAASRGLRKPKKEQVPG